MSSSFSLFPCLFSCFFVVTTMFSSSSMILVEAEVPQSKTFKYVSTFTERNFNLMAEYGQNYIMLPVANSPFGLYFYSHGPRETNTVYLSLGMGDLESFPKLLRWVWTANRENPVGENATLTFQRDGNLVLANANGRVAWQTGTANKGVVDLKLLPNGNLVLINKQGKFVWESFNYPTDTLLLGQSLYLQGPFTNKLVSISSESDGSPGRYSMVLNTTGVDLFFKSAGSEPEQVRYLNLVENFMDEDEIPQNITFRLTSKDEAGGPDFANTLRLQQIDRLQPGIALAKPKYNATLSFLRLGWDGNVRVYTYYENGPIESAWEQTYTMLSRVSNPNECALPERCGSFGLCEDSQCVACPTPKGLMGWSKDCKPMKVPAPCSNNNSTNAAKKNVRYLSIGDVNTKDYMSNTDKGVATGPTSIDECRKKCTDDCKCVGFYYETQNSKCLLSTQLNTMMKNMNPIIPNGNFLFIKYTK